MIVSFVRYDHVMLKKSYFLLGIQTEVFIGEMIIYFSFKTFQKNKVK